MRAGKSNAGSAGLLTGVPNDRSSSLGWLTGHCADVLVRALCLRLLYWGVVQTRIKPYQQQVAEEQRRAEQRRIYRRNQVFGLLMVAAAICAWWLWHTNPKWIFPPGWWRP